MTNRKLEPVNLEKDGELVLPFSSRSRLLAWVRQRFSLRNRKAFWAIFAVVTAALVLSSGNLIDALTRGPLLILSIVPGLHYPISDFLSRPEVDQFFRAVDLLRQNSFTDKVIGSVILSLNFVNFAEVGKTSPVIGIGAVLIWVVILARFFRTPAHLSVSKEGLRLVWTRRFKSFLEPVVPWQEIVSVSYRPQTLRTPDGTIVLKYTGNRWQYKLFQPAGSLGHEFLLNVANLETLEQRHGLARALEEWAPPNTVQPEVMDVLVATQSQAYTELWLQALNESNKRQAMEPLPSGRQLQNGKYRICAQLAVGGQGTAYLANDEHQDSSASANVGARWQHEEEARSRNESESGGTISPKDSNIVIKEFVLPVYVDSNSRKQALRKFLDEADLLRRLDDERVVKLQDCFVEDHRGYLVMERIKGRSLRDRVLSDGPLTESRVFDLLEQMLSVLTYLHSQEPPVVHRDFAPDNLILGDDGVLKLIDFNVAQQAETTMTGSIVGKPSYVPPEQLRGMALPGSDIYALGATLHFLLTGCDPEPLSVCHPQSALKGIDSRLDQLVSTCTQLDASQRFASVEEIRRFIAQNF